MIRPTARTHLELVAELHAQAALDDAAELAEQTSRAVW